jgi:hypothetical protein
MCAKRRQELRESSSRTEGEATPNARGRRGPGTREGKARIRYNARKHGGWSTAPVLPGLEDPAQWRDHLARLWADFEPATYIEECLVYDIAHTIWRIRRVNRYEEALLREEQQRDVEQDLMREWREKMGREDVFPRSLTAEEAQHEFERRSALLTRLAQMAATEPVSDADVLVVLQACGDPEATHVDASRLITPGSWTAGRVCERVRKLARSHGKDTSALLEEAAKDMQLRANVLEVIHLGSDARRRDLRELRLVMPDQQDGLIRVRAHLNRHLFQVLRARGDARTPRRGRRPAGPT